MDTTAGFSGLRCTDCEEHFAAADTPGRCPACGGILDPTYALHDLDIDRSDLADRPFEDLWRYREILPFPPTDAVRLGAGATPLVASPHLADEFGVSSVYIKDEGQNPTGSFKDRGQTLAMTAAVAHDAPAVALPSAEMPARLRPHTRQGQALTHGSSCRPDPPSRTRP